MKAIFGLSIFACALGAGFAAKPEAQRLRPALDTITPDKLLANIKVLASDEFEGRAPGSKGEELSVKYISDQFKQIGLKPGNPAGTYFQEVPLAGITAAPSASFVVNGQAMPLIIPTTTLLPRPGCRTRLK